ncbi:MULTISPECIES: helix-turn-helix transcriptional regulator [unclassified Streptomyces]|jgi:transcriptional regulator with XRE-family HTH domain|uniref:helix-turn-helix transcriptional regulator n=1 Tax=unclassified Streptomyces TaxID=2593676 RepID=UPI000749671C|nr:MULTISPECIES: helix-turn-helix transcriptional regulator [unclassified Streptomyces]KUL69229.1 transcriptional regulator [Streptomyces sp. NRRL WC-3604]KUL69353.1 transcriptional regulator [Streptomyces sp. NRRL WC-3605]
MNRAPARPLGDFLRASRARLEPSDVGLPAGSGTRRVRGLRREEVAVLAGVSVDYYVRLEQGRESSPSPQVVGALGRALRLTADGRTHLYRLAGLSPSATVGHRRDRVHPDLLRLLDAFPDAAAYVLGPAFDILATNVIADALLEPFDGERNMPRILFTHPRARDVFPDRRLITSSTVYALRLNAARFGDVPEIGELVQELLQASAEFRALWNDQNVGALTRAFKVFVHPEAGRVELTYESFEVRAAPGQELLVGSAEPGSRSAQALTYLASMAAPRR